MKKLINKITFVLAAVMLLVSCEADYIMFDSSKNFVAFPNDATEVLEPGGMVAIPIYVVALEGAPAITVDFDFDITDIANAAVEGEDYTLVNDSKTLSISEGWGYDTIWIQPIDNDIFEGNKYFNIVLTSNSQNYQFGAISTQVVTLVDDEHPLKNWLRTYTVDAVDYWSYFGPETWTVTTSVDPSDVNNLMVTGIGADFGEYTSIIGAVDMEAMTITFSASAEIGTHKNYGGPLAVFKGDEAGNLYEEPIVGEIKEDGSIYVDLLGIRFVGGINAGLDWGVYETTWTPAKKKAAPVVFPFADQVQVLKSQR